MRLLTILWLTTWVAWASFETKPSLGVALPLPDKVDDGVVRFLIPVAINSTTIVPPDAILRVIYVQPQSGDVETLQARQRKNSDNVVSRPQQEVIKRQAKLSAEQEAARKIANETVWPSPVNFKLAAENLNGDLRLVYLLPTGELRQETFSLVQGLFLGQKNHAVIILAVEKDSPGDKAGLLAGDEILKIGGTDVSGNLENTLNLERTSRLTSQASSKPSIPWIIRKADGSGESEVAIRTPPSLKGSLFDLK
jgi:hypothetical protein